MRAVGKAILVVSMLGLAGAGPDDRPVRVESDVVKLRAEVRMLREQLEVARAEKAQLERALAAMRGRPNWYVQPLPPGVRMPTAVPPGPAIPPGSVERGEGNVRHYVIPVSPDDVVTGR